MAFPSIISNGFQFSYQKLKSSTKKPFGCESSHRKASNAPAHDVPKNFHQTRHGKLNFRGRKRNLPAASAARRRQRVAVQLSRHLRPGWIKSAVSSLLRKTKEAFAGINSNAGRHGGRRAEFTYMEPYFSMPVLPPPTSTVMHV
ncbi:unnamed protein product [Victoria cruziana]